MGRDFCATEAEPPHKVCYSFVAYFFTLNYATAGT
jgi:hypothetical protein